MTSTLIKVAIADDHTAVRQAFKQVLSLQPFITILFEADNGLDLMNKLKHYQPDVLLLDIKMPKVSGIEVLKLISDNNTNTHILILSAYADEFYVAQCLQYGINGYLTKSMDLEEIVKAIQLAYNNELYYTNLLNNPLLRNYLVKNKKGLNNLVPEFTQEEIEILTLMVQEKNTEEISAIMNLSKRSIEIKRDKMRQKANVKTVGGLLLYALKRELIH